MVRESLGRDGEELYVTINFDGAPPPDAKTDREAANTAANAAVNASHRHLPAHVSVAVPVDVARSSREDMREAVLAKAIKEGFLYMVGSDGKASRENRSQGRCSPANDEV